MVSLSFYDLDRTITRYPTFTPFLLYVAWKEARLKLLGLPIWIGAMACYAIGLIDRKVLKQFGFAMFVGRRLNTRRAEALVRGFADWHFNGRLQPGALESLEQDRRAGRRIVLVTAAPDVYAEEFGRRLGIDDIIGTCHLREADGTILYLIDGLNCHGKEKLSRSLKWLRSKCISREECHVRVYSDALSDTPLLNFADEAVLVTARTKWAKIAKRSGWKPVDFAKSHSDRGASLQKVVSTSLYLPLIILLG